MCRMFNKVKGCKALSLQIAGGVGGVMVVVEGLATQLVDKQGLLGVAFA